MKVKKKEEQIPLVLFPSSSSLLLKYIRKRVEFWSKEKKKKVKGGTGCGKEITAYWLFKRRGI